MARCSVEQKSVVKKVERTVEEEEYVLRLTSDEARTLHNIVTSIGGCPIDSRRRHADAIKNALESNGINSPHRLFDEDQAREEGFLKEKDNRDIYYQDHPNPDELE